MRTGENFGLGSSREQAAAALIELGIGAVIADGGLLAHLEKKLKGQPA